MEVTHETVDRLEDIFKEVWGRVRYGHVPQGVSVESVPRDPSWTWVLYMNSLDVLVVDHEDLLESFPDMVNFGMAVKESVCVRNPADESSFLLVPMGLADKCLVLGALA